MLYITAKQEDSPAFRSLNVADNAYAVCLLMSLLSSTGKLFRSKDLMDFVHFFLIFYRAKPIDVLLDDIALLRMCSFGGPLVSVPGGGVYLGRAYHECLA